MQMWLWEWVWVCELHVSRWREACMFHVLCVCRQLVVCLSSVYGCKPHVHTLCDMYVCVRACVHACVCVCVCVCAAWCVSLAM